MAVDKSMLQQVHLEASVAVYEAMLEQAHVKATVALDKSMLQQVYPWRDCSSWVRLHLEQVQA